MDEGKKPTAFEAWFMETVGNLSMVALVIGACAAAYQAWAWWGARRPSGDDCWFVVHKDPEQMCVVARDLGKEISPAALKQVVEKQPPLMCGTPMEAADFVQKAGHKICEHTAIREGAKFAPP